MFLERRIKSFNHLVILLGVLRSKQLQSPLHSTVFYGGQCKQRRNYRIWWMHQLRLLWIVWLFLRLAALALADDVNDLFNCEKDCVPWLSLSPPCGIRTRRQYNINIYLFPTYVCANFYIFDGRSQYHASNHIHAGIKQCYNYYWCHPRSSSPSWHLISSIAARHYAWWWVAFAAQRSSSTFPSDGQAESMITSSHNKHRSYVCIVRVSSLIREAKGSTRCWYQALYIHTCTRIFGARPTLFTNNSHAFYD